MTDLSPAAQSVMDAFFEGVNYLEDVSPSNVAAALQAAADQFFYDWNGMCCEEHLKAIAAELEAHS